MDRENTQVKEPGMDIDQSPTAAIERYVSQYRSGAFGKNVLWDRLADLPADRIEEMLNAIPPAAQ